MADSTDKKVRELFQAVWGAYKKSSRITQTTIEDIKRLYKEVDGLMKAESRPIATYQGGVDGMPQEFIGATVLHVLHALDNPRPDSLIQEISKYELELNPADDPYSIYRITGQGKWASTPVLAARFRFEALRTETSSPPILPDGYC